MSVPGKLLYGFVSLATLVFFFSVSTVSAQGGVAAAPVPAPPPAGPACVVDATAAAGAPAINGLDSGPSIRVSGKLPGGGKTGICIQISISHPGAPQITKQATVAADGTFSSDPTALAPGDSVSAEEIVTPAAGGAAASYGTPSPTAIVGKCSENVTVITPVAMLDAISSSTLVSGKINVVPGSTVRVCADDYELGRGVVVANGGFVVRLEAALAANQKVSAQQVLTPAAAGAMDAYGTISAVSVFAATPTSAPTAQINAECIKATRPYLLTDAVAGVKHLVGCAESGAVASQVVIYTVPTTAGAAANSPISSPTVCGTNGAFHVGASSLGTPDANGEFQVDLPSSGVTVGGLPLGDWVCLIDYKADNSVMDPDAQATYVAKWSAEESASPWGRVRMYFAGGILLSQTNGEFSNQNLYLSFDLDKNWHHGQKTMFNTYFNAQLTSVPAAACANPSTSTTASSPSSACTSSTSATSFISSQKGGVVQGGLYIPLIANAWRWSHDGRDNALFVAPILKAGVDTLANTSQVTQGLSSTIQTASTVSGENVFKFYAAGFRFGHFGMSHSWNVAPYLFSFLDFTVGQWQSFRQCLNFVCTAPSSGSSTQPTNLVLPLMVGLTGRLMIPKTPVLVGFDSYIPITHSNQVHGDLRFLFGVRLDVGCLFNALTGQSTGSASILTCSEGPVTSKAGGTASNSTVPTPPKTPGT